VEIPNRNVIILGAGASYDAGIPLMNQFVEMMWEIAEKKKAGGISLNETDLQIFEKAIQIRKEIDGFHGRASFDDQNLEDILSILSFEDQFSKDKKIKNVEAIVKAITRTIELTCLVKPNVNLHTIQKQKSDVHIAFWSNLIDVFSDTLILPTLITFNYDLVLERSLFHLFINPTIKEIPFNNFTINMQYKKLENISYEIQHTYYRQRDINDELYQTSGSKVNYLDQGQKRGLQIEILKLHGSLNFGRDNINNPGDLSPIIAVENPVIIPPVANKQLSGELRSIWTLALERLRVARNIIFLGYSLPETDIYFRFFLKTAIGPNTDLNKIYIFNPGIDDDMRKRYLSCFSDQYRKRVEFNIMPPELRLTERLGTFKYFNQLILEYNERLFYK
jgi:hypothetical protein